MNTYPIVKTLDFFVKLNSLIHIGIICTSEGMDITSPALGDKRETAVEKSALGDESSILYVERASKETQGFRFE